MEKQNNVESLDALKQNIIAEKVLREINRKQNEAELDLERDIFQKELTVKDAKILIDQLEYTDYLSQPASSSQRLLAYVVDVVTILFVSMTIVSVLLLSMKASLPQMNSSVYSSKLIQLAIMTFMFVYMGYFSFLDARRFSTIGKHFLNIKVTTEMGQPITIAQSFVRTALAILTLGNFQDNLTDTKVIKG
jgi:cation transport ATPase